MNFSTAVSTCLSKFATFSGRASRSEFWWFYLFVCLITWGVLLVEFGFGGVGLVGNIISLVFWLPLLAAGSRRLHDIDRSGWWQLLIITGIGTIVLIVFWCFDTKPETNSHGYPTKGAGGASVGSVAQDLDHITGDGAPEGGVVTRV